MTPCARTDCDAVTVRSADWQYFREYWVKCIEIWHADRFNDRLCTYLIPVTILMCNREKFGDEKFGNLASLRFRVPDIFRHCAASSPPLDFVDGHFASFSTHCPILSGEYGGKCRPLDSSNSCELGILPNVVTVQFNFRFRFKFRPNIC